MNNVNDTTRTMRHCAYGDLPPLPQGEEWLSEYAPTHGEWGWVSTMDFTEESLNDLRQLLEESEVSQ